MTDRQAKTEPYRYQNTHSYIVTLELRIIAVRVEQVRGIGCGVSSYYITLFALSVCPGIRPPHNAALLCVNMYFVT